MQDIQISLSHVLLMIDFLVVSSAENASAVASNTLRIAKITFQVLEKLSQSDSVSLMAPSQELWARNAFTWSAQIGVGDSSSDLYSIGLPFALPSDDGRYLVGVVTSPPMSARMEVMRSYRKHESGSEMVKSEAC